MSQQEGVQMIGKKMPFITCEGLDGSGLSTQAFILKEWLTKKGHEVHLTKEPTDGLIGSLIRGALRKELFFDPEALALLFAADRMKHNKDILKFLYEGVIVISDRYRLSSYAYQSIEMDLEWVKKINEKSINPDLTFIIDTSPRVCIKRIATQRFSFELYEEKPELEKVRENYYALSEEEKNTFSIDGDRIIEIVSNDIFKIVRESKLIEGLELNE